MGQLRRARRDSAESLNDWRAVSSPLRKLEAPSSKLALGLCLAFLLTMVFIGALTRSSWVAAVASALCFGVAIGNASSHGMRCLRCGRLTALPLRSSTHLDLMPDPRRCERCHESPPEGLL
jgi:hypothetical protein